MTFFFDVKLDVFFAPSAAPVCVSGLSIFNKKVVLYGSEGNVRIYSSDCSYDDLDSKNMPHKNLPRATVQVADPIALSARVCECKKPCKPSCHIPDCICKRYGGDFSCNNQSKEVFVTIGLFTIVQIERNVQMLIPAYDFCIPHKECVTTSDNPCELFGKIEFPIDEFFPPKMEENDNEGGYGCGCSHCH